MKTWRVSIFNLCELVFGKSELVDDKELYLIDYEGYNKDHPKRPREKNNDDLQVVSREGSDSGSPSP